VAQERASRPTLEQIAGALYHHFADRADLYDAVLREQADQVMHPCWPAWPAEGHPCSGCAGSGPSWTCCCSRGGRTPPQRSPYQTRLGYRAWLGAVEAVREEAHTRGELLYEVTPAG
jgi:hypothetical protein